MGNLCENLLEKWCDGLYRLQIRNTKEPRLDGGLLCPACGRIHGRCADAMYPFLCMAAKSGDRKWIEAAKGLFAWTEHTVSRINGSLHNDIDSDWTGITVFYAIQLANCLYYHGELLDKETYRTWTNRLRKAAEYLCTCEELWENNINYPISNALALFSCSRVLKEERYQKRAQDYARAAQEILTKNNLVAGEGIPREKKSTMGCQSVDIGYNVEETLPALLLYGIMSGDECAEKIARKGLLAHLDFLLDDGAWNNSFGTRNYKWTYWGSRTSDGCALGYLSALERMEKPEDKLVCAEAALKNLKLLDTCTENGLLMGGPHYKAAGQPSCIHHTFTHAKILAEILERELNLLLEEYEEKQNDSTILGVLIRDYPELRTWNVATTDMKATVTAYDWEYLPGGHVSGGTLSMLYHRLSGPILCAGMGEYSLKEPNNMQIPVNCIHECLALRIEKETGGMRYSSIYEDKVSVEMREQIIRCTGYLKDEKHQDPPEGRIPYSIQYIFKEQEVVIEAEFSQGCLICPIISRIDEEVMNQSEYGRLDVRKQGTVVRMATDGVMKLPYGTERIFHLIPGLQALKIEVKPKQECRVRIGLKVDGMLLEEGEQGNTVVLEMIN